jgi:hypothetical protein
MSTRSIINLILLLAIVILSLVARYEPGIEAPTEPDSITGITASQVHRIHINRPIRNDLVFVKQSDKHWVMEGPTSVPADSFKIRALARLAEQKPVRSYTIDEMKLVDLQLDPPYASVIINNTAIEFGILEPIDDLRYVRVNDKVHLIPDSHLQLMETGFSQFVRPRLFGEDQTINAIQLPDLLVSKTTRGWETQPPQSVSTDDLVKFIASWQQASSLHIQPASTELDGEVVETRFSNNATPVRLLIVARDPVLILARPDYGIQYRLGVPGEALLSLDAAAAAAGD